MRLYRQWSSKEPDFVFKAVMPNPENATDVMDRDRGIPRLSGDLILTYIDHESVEQNMVLALKAAKDTAIVNQAQKCVWGVLFLGRALRRGDLWSSSVGNLGGARSLVEITCMGGPINLGARTDAPAPNPGRKPAEAFARCLVMRQEINQIREKRGSSTRIIASPSDRDSADLWVFSDPDYHG